MHHNENSHQLRVLQSKNANINCIITDINGDVIDTSPALPSLVQIPSANKVESDPRMIYSPASSTANNGRRIVQNTQGGAASGSASASSPDSQIDIDIIIFPNRNVTTLHYHFKS